MQMSFRNVQMNLIQFHPTLQVHYTDNYRLISCIIGSGQWIDRCYPPRSFHHFPFEDAFRMVPKFITHQDKVRNDLEPLIVVEFIEVTSQQWQECLSHYYKLYSR